MKRSAMMAVFLVVAATAVDAHVTVSPTESRPGVGERYTVRVPSEGKVSIAVELEVPADVRITGVLVGGGFTYETRREGDRVVAITWKQEIKAGEIGEFVFFALNPKTETRLAWKARQRFSDGTSADWIGVEGDLRSASVTQLKAAR